MEEPDISAIELTEGSICSFNDLWALEGAPYFDDDLVFPKSPGHAANMYYDYWKQFLAIDRTKKIIAVENPFLLDLKQFRPGLPNYIGRIDLILENPDGFLEIIDHKTAKAIYQTTFAGFEASLQTDGYLTIGNMYYDSIPRMVYNIALCQKSKIAFERFTIIKRKNVFERFINDLIFYAEDIIHNLKLFQEDLINATTRESHINSFRRCPGYACTAYMAPCPYLDICKLRSNPLLWKDCPPQGYTINEWDPETHEADMKKRLKESLL